MVKNYRVRFLGVRRPFLHLKAACLAALSVLLMAAVSIAQTTHLEDDFEDNNIVGWQEGVNGHWAASNLLPLTGAFSLKHNLTNIAGSSFITRYLKDIDVNTGTTTWRFNLANENWDPSSSNRFWMYLVADEPNLLSGTIDGYAVGVNMMGSSDLLTLWRVTGGVASATLIESTLDWNPNNFIGIEVTRDGNGLWELKFDNNGGFDALQSAGTFTDITYSAPAFCWSGLVFQYTADRAGRFRADDVSVKNTATIPPSPPILQTVNVLSAQELELLFNEPLEEASAVSLPNYFVNNGLGNPVGATLLGTSAVKLTFGGAFVNTQENLVSVSGVKDLSGHAIVNPQSKPFIYYQPVIPKYNDLVITEIMAAPNAVLTQMPNTEFVEIRNRTNGLVKLKDFKFSDASNSAVIGDFGILPNDRVILCPAAAVNSFIPLYGSASNIIGLNGFPSLNNDSDLLSLRDQNGQLIFSVNYSDAWYKDEVKKQGGWTLEMIDPIANPCGEASNWRASQNLKGGTPRAENSVAAPQPDLTGPVLKRATAQSAQQVKLVFNEKTDSASATDKAHYAFDQGLQVVKAEALSPRFDSVLLDSNVPFEAGKVYKVTVGAGTIKDCAGNAVPVGGQSAVFALPEQGGPSDVVINEVLFNPNPGGTDFVEIYNKSKKYVNLQNWRLADDQDQVLIVQEPYVLFPGAYAVITANGAVLRGQYPNAREDTFIEPSSLPSFNDDKGIVILRNNLNEEVDRFDYDENFHFALLDNKEGVSLERTAFHLPTNTPSSWHSASASAGYATPGYLNSQYFEGAGAGSGIAVEPKTFSPDQDGFKDFVRIAYKFDQPGYTATITVFDSQGRITKRICRNQLLGAEGFFTWDGTTEDGRKAAVDYYIVLAEVFNLSGEVKAFKEKVALGARF